MSNYLERTQQSFFPLNNSQETLSQDDLEDGPVDEEFCLDLPFSDLHGWVYSKDELCKIYHIVRPFDRLVYIKSLSFLDYFNSDIKIENQYLYSYTHDRGDHTYVVAGTGAQILNENNFNDSDTKKFLIAAFLHDFATPALGDVTKFIDPKNLHEELHWQKMLNPEINQYFKDNDIDKEEIDLIIKNEGTLGEVLDIADRITYVMKDLSNFIQKIIKRNVAKNNYRNNLDKFINLNPKIGNIYQDVKIDKNSSTVYFDNPSRLQKFLHLRALLHQNVYMHPISQGRDFYIASFIKPFYTIDPSQNHLLTPDCLRKMTDRELIDFLAQKYNKSCTEFYRCLERWYPQYYEKFSDIESAEKRRDELKNNSSFNIIGIKQCKGFNPSTSYKVKNKSGQIIEYRQYDPQGAKVIENIAKKVKGVFLYYEDKKRTSIFD